MTKNKMLLASSEDTNMQSMTNSDPDTAARISGDFVEVLIDHNPSMSSNLVEGDRNLSESSNVPGGLFK